MWEFIGGVGTEGREWERIEGQGGMEETIRNNAYRIHIFVMLSLFELDVVFSLELDVDFFVLLNFS